MKRILVACECSGTVRDAFAALGHDAWSCDLVPTDKPGKHIQADVLTVLDYGWDLMIAHPPCNKLSYAGNRYLTRPGRWDEIIKALVFFKRIMDAPISQIAIENPRGWALKYIRKADQTIEPYHFGHPVTKATCLWLKELPPLMATMVCDDPFINWARNKKGSHSAKERAVTFPGIAAAMAAQWGDYGEVSKAAA